MLQFYAGDFFEIIPLLKERYSYNNHVEVFCQATEPGLEFYRAGVHSFNVTMGYVCELSVMRDKFLDLVLGLELELEDNTSVKTMNFKLKRCGHSPIFYPHREYQMENVERAKEMLRRSLERMSEVNLFGNGFPVGLERRKPEMHAEGEFTVVVDTAMIDPDRVGARDKRKIEVG